MKNLLLIKTTVDFDIKKHLLGPPLGLMYLAAFIKKFSPSKYHIDLIDMRLPKMSFAEMKKYILRLKPDFLACSVMTIEHRCMHELAKLAKDIDKKIRIIVGGPHATIYYQEILKDENIDIAVVGEGEATFAELINGLEQDEDIKNVPGIALRRNHKIQFTGMRKSIENLDCLPFPDWDLIDIRQYSKLNAPTINFISAGKKYMFIFTSRGCPYQCIYCHRIFGKNYRTRSAENVFAEIKTLYDQYRVDEFQIIDDVFNLDIDRAKKICELIINSKIKIKIAFPNALRGDRMDEELILKLKQAGTYQVTYALETASPRLQKTIKKNMDIPKLRHAIIFSHQQGLLTKLFCMLGFPTETFEEAKRTIRFVCRLPLTFASFFVVIPHENTELFKIVKEFSSFFEVNYDSDYYSVLKNNEYEEIIKLPLKKLQERAYLRFYLDPIRILRIFSKIPKKSDLFLLLATFFRYFVKEKISKKRRKNAWTPLCRPSG